MRNSSLKRLLLPGMILLPALLIVLFEAMKGQKSWMDRWVSGVMAPVEQALGRICALLPWISVAEVLTALFLLGSVFWLIRAAVLLMRERAAGRFLRRLLAFASAVLWLWAAVSWMWNVAYYASGVQEKSGLEVRPYSVETLAQVTALFAQQAAEFSTQVERDEEGLFSVSLEESFGRGPAIYENIVKEFPFLELEPSVRVKPLLCSRLQSILGFTGVYFPFTGEANVNTDAPACMIPATIAHEMAHQRMVASEQEANFVGITAAVLSGDPVFQYSGYLMGLVQLCNALAPVDREAWNAIVQQYFTQEMASDWNANNAYWAELSSPVEETAGQVYDSFLKGNGQKLGMRSYGACVDLLVAYFGAE